MTYAPIIHSMLDDDWYKITQAAVVFHFFPRTVVTYEFINRKKVEFPDGFDKELREELIELQTLTLTADESLWMNKIPYMRPTFVEWFRNYQYNPSDVSITQNNGDLKILIHGLWYRNILWEVKLMAIISELYFRMTGKTMDSMWDLRIREKASKLSNAGCSWCDFGTRRRYSYQVQDEVVKTMKQYRGFLGTSNPHFAHKHGVTPIGTYAHESVMGMSGIFGAKNANKMWMKYWTEYYNGELGIALTDTFTTGVFLRDFDSFYARLFDGVRQDSGDPIEWGKMMINHYNNLRIPTEYKKFVFSDNLNVDKYINIHNTFKNVVIPIAGIGTNFTNDVGQIPLNMVIKMTVCDGKNVVKLSDDLSKTTGDMTARNQVMEALF
jgi:nicotinate phosphoribosyltransferase